VEQQAPAVIQLEQEIFAQPRQTHTAATSQAFAQSGGRSDEKVTLGGRANALDHATEKSWLELTTSDFDFG
jgi:hypothetical protein